MSQNDMSISNASGASVRTDINSALQALVSNNSGSSAPSTTYAYMFWVDTSGGSPILKMRNGANTSWITLGYCDIANLGAALLTGAIFSGALTFTNTDYMKFPIGTTAQRPGSPANGMVRYNTDTKAFEGYGGNVGAWVTFGAGSQAFGILGVETLTSNRVMTGSDDGAMFLANPSTTAGLTITLPSASANLKFMVKDISGKATSRNITIVRAAAESIEGVAANYICQADYGRWAFACDGTNWHIIK